MSLKRIFYFNLLYKCNNNCIFCFSHNTFHKKDGEISLIDIINIDRKYHFLSNDRVIINGGEPTLCKDIFLIIKYLQSKGVEIVVYSNGRLFRDENFSRMFLASGKIRITIPIHGTEVIHDIITDVKGSFKDTVAGINNLLRLKEYYPLEFELKVIVNRSLASIKDDFLCILDKIVPVGAIDTFVISGMVDTDVSKKNNYSAPPKIKVAAFAEDLYLQFHSKYPKLKFKFEDICVFFFSDNLKKEIMLDIENFTPIDYQFLFFDKTNIDGRICEYNDKIQDVDCQKCIFQSICSQISPSYKVMYYDGSWRNELE